MDPKEFQDTVLKGVESLGTQQKEFSKKFDELQTETKQAIGELGAVKKEVNNLAEVSAKLQKAQMALQTERRIHAGDPVKRIMADEAKARTIFAVLKATKGYKLTEAEQAVVKTALTEGGTPGSTYISGDLARDVYDVLGMYGAWNTLGVRSVGTKTTKFPVKTARPVASWLTTQGGQISEDATKAGTSVDLEILTMAVLLGVSRELIEDAEIDVVADVLNDFGEACAYRLDWSAFAADGTSDATDGGYTGIAVGGTAAGAAAGNVSVATLDMDDFVKCLTTVAAGVLRRGCRWWIHPQILAKICLLKDGNGRPIFQTANEAPAPGAIGSILGYPVILADAMPSTDTTSKVIAVFGDPQGCAVGVRKQFEFAASDQHLFDYNQIAYRGIMRAGVKVRAATAFAMLTTAAS